MRPVRGFRGIRQLVDAPGSTLDKSVLDRLNADPAEHRDLDEPYRPENLLAYLAANPDYDSGLSPEVLGAVKKLRS